MSLRENDAEAVSWGMGGEARRAIESNREDSAKSALERKNTNLLQVQGLDKQITEIETEQQKLEDTEKRLSNKVEEFKSKKEVIKAQFSAAEGRVRTRELTGISEETADVDEQEGHVVAE